MLKHINSPQTNSQITHLVDKDIQPNAVDVRVGRVFRIHGGTFTLSEDVKGHLEKEEIQPVDGYYNLVPGRYDIVMQNEVEVSENECGWIVPRSTVTRNGFFIVSGLYDSGYKGVVGGCLHAWMPMKLQQGVRIAQFVTANAEMLNKYDGDYGNGKEHDKLYEE